MARETGWYRTESGVVLEMGHPLLDGIVHRVAKGEIIRVANAAGDPYVEETAPSTKATARKTTAR